MSGRGLVYGGRSFVGGGSAWTPALLFKRGVAVGRLACSLVVLVVVASSWVRAAAPPLADSEASASTLGAAPASTSGAAPAVVSAVWQQLKEAASAPSAAEAGDFSPFLSAARPLATTGTFQGKRGTCAKGQTYTITSTEQLDELIDEIDCIYALGHAPKFIPVGLMRGTVIYVGYEFMSKLLEPFWMGKLIQRSQCLDADTGFYLVSNMILGPFLSPSIPCYVYTGHLVLPTHPAEGLAKDTNAHLFCDYTVHWQDVCPYNPNAKDAYVNLGAYNGIPYGGASVDILRVVGRSASGGWILLGRSMIRDVNDPTKGLRTGALWTLTSYDSRAFAGLPMTLGPLAESFDWELPSVVKVAESSLAIDNFFKNPWATMERVAYNNFLKTAGFPPSPLNEEFRKRWPMAGEPAEGTIEEVGRKITADHPIPKPVGLGIRPYA
eukprot:GHVT01095334.1.p1 GENE.GHVT01095334.1~~GHVT01095334.1.p1  ORF type:complete len:438 (+),score=72.29 GHVT01095334.1:239-1552(+)